MEDGLVLLESFPNLVEADKEPEEGMALTQQEQSWFQLERVVQQ